MSAPILSFQDVTFGYQHNKAPALRNMDFSLQPGRVTAILGPNGAGKTTLLYLALGWLHPWDGQIQFQGTPLVHRTRQERGRWVALVPQSEHTPFDYNVLDYVLMGRSPHLPPLGIPAEIDYQTTWQALEQVGLAEIADQPVPQLSSGERKLMLLARAINQNSRLLLLDEPTAHLDLRNKSRLIRLLRSLQTQGTTILIASHEPEVVLALADDVLLIEPDGTTRFGSLEKVFTSETLSRIYQIPIRLVDVDGHQQVIWT